MPGKGVRKALIVVWYFVFECWGTEFSPSLEPPRETTAIDGVGGGGGRQPRGALSGTCA